MKPNVGAFDGWFRTLLFILTVCYVIMGGSWIWLIPTAVFFLTAVVEWCPIYEIVGLSTDKDEASN